MSDYGVKVSKAGVDADQKTGLFEDVLDLPLNMRTPMAKLDTANPVSFQNISLTFNTDPPEPTGAGEEARTVAYSFKHGYNYAPTVWSLAQVVQRPNSPGAYVQSFWQTVGILRSNSAFDFAALQIDNDDDSVFLRVRKWYNTGLGGSTNNIIGCTVLIRVYVFVEDYDIDPVLFES